MKLSFLLLIIPLLPVSASSYAQGITLSKQNATLPEIFTELRKQTDYTFLYSSTLISNAMKVSISVKNAQINDVLDRCFEDQALTYTISNNTITVKEKPQSLFNRILKHFSAVIITGTVSDEQGNVLPGATVKLQGSKITTRTNEQGIFSITSDKINGVLVISYLGYETLQVAFGETNTGPFNVILKEEENGLKEIEVVSTGYQNLPKERATGSFTQPNLQMLNARVAPNVIGKLEGITSGLVFNKNTIASNAGKTDLSIRGRSTIFANDQPLIVVDNFPFEGDINTLNPNDVATITILKDAAAASIWGVRAGNGVIVITTKKGSLRSLNINVNANITATNKPDLFYNPNFLSSKDYIAIESFLFNNGKYNAALNDKVNFPVVSPVVQILNRKKNNLITEAAATDLLNGLSAIDVRNQQEQYFYRTPFAQQYSLAISGGTEKSNYYFSSGYDKSMSAMIGNNNDRITLNSQNTFKPFKNMELSAGINYVFGRTTADNTLINGVIAGTNYQPYLQFANINADPLIMDKDVNAEYKAQAPGKGFLDWSYVPLNELEQAPIKNKTNDLRITAGMKYTFIPGLSADIKFQHQQVDNLGRQFKSMDTYDVRSMINKYSVLTSGNVSSYNVPMGGILYLSNGYFTANYIRGQLNFEREWDKHAITAIGGYELSEQSRSSSGATYYGYDDELGSSSKVNYINTFPLNPTGNASIPGSQGLTGALDRLRSIYANFAYTYNDKYTLSASARVDGSNYFGVKTNQKNVPLWSTGALWNIDKENFYKLDWLPILKLRVSYGFNGNLDKGNTGITTFKYSLAPANPSNLPFAEIANLGNPELRWEKIGITNVGLNFGSRNLRISGSLEYFWKKGTDILGDKPFAASTGIAKLRGNYSDMKSRGLDLSLNSMNLKGKFSWNTSALFSIAKDKVTRYEVVDPFSSNFVGTYNFYPVENRPVYGIYAYKWAGLDPQNGDPMGYLNGQMSKDYTSIVNSTTFDELEYFGTARPGISGGLMNSFSYNRFTLSFNISYKLNYYFRRPSVNYYNLYNLGITQSMNKDFVDRWQVPGDELKTSVPSMAKYTESRFRDQFYQASSVTVERADHIRLQDVSFSYDLGNAMLKTIGLRQLQFYLYANNLGILWKANRSGLDPDVIPNAGNFLATPDPRSISFGLKTSF